MDPVCVIGTAGSSTTHHCFFVMSDWNRHEQASTSLQFKVILHEMETGRWRQLNVTGWTQDFNGIEFRHSNIINGRLYLLFRRYNLQLEHHESRVAHYDIAS